MEEDKEKYKIVNKYLSVWNTIIDLMLWVSLLFSLSTDNYNRAILYTLFIIYRLLNDRLPKKDE